VSDYCRVKPEYICMFKRFNKNIQYILTFLFLIVIVSLNPHSISNTCRVNAQITNFNFFVDSTFVCCFPASNNFSKTYFFINSNEELNFKLSSRKFHVLPQSVYEYSQNSVSVKVCMGIKQLINSPDIPISTSSLLIWYLLLLSNFYNPVFCISRTLLMW